MSFTDRTAVVTGGTQGIGEALVRRLADDGLRAAVIVGRDVGRGTAVANDLSAAGCDTRFVAADLVEPEAPATIMGAAAEHLGFVDHLANCAGSSARGTIWDTTADLFDRLMAINVRAPFLLIQAVARQARAAGRPASVVNVGSVAGHGGQEYLTPYATSKGALITLTRNVAYSLMRDHVRVNVINPGWMATPGEDAIQRAAHGARDGWLEEAAARMPFGRLIDPDELAATLAFVLSDASGMMTGSVIDFDQTVTGAGPRAIAPPG